MESDITDISQIKNQLEFLLIQRLTGGKNYEDEQKNGDFSWCRFSSLWQ